MNPKRTVHSHVSLDTHRQQAGVKGRLSRGGVVGNMGRDRAGGQGLNTQPHLLLSLPPVYAPPQPRATLSSPRVRALRIAGAMPFGHHNHHAHNDPAQGIYAAASALGSM